MVFLFGTNQWFLAMPVVPTQLSFFYRTPHFLILLYPIILLRFTVVNTYIYTWIKAASLSFIRDIKILCCINTPCLHKVNELLWILPITVLMLSFPPAGAKHRSYWIVSGLTKKLHYYQNPWRWYVTQKHPSWIRSEKPIQSFKICSIYLMPTINVEKVGKLYQDRREGTKWTDSWRCDLFVKGTVFQVCLY